MSNKKPTHQGIVFQSPRGKKEWYWHIKAIRGGKIIACSGEGFGSSGVAKRAMNNAIKVMSGNVEIVVEPSLAKKKAAKAKEKAAKAKARAKKAKAKKTTARRKTKKTPTKAKKTTRKRPQAKRNTKTKAKKTPTKRAKKMSVVEGGASEKAA